MNLISCGLVSEERDDLLAKCDLSMATRAVLYSAVELGAPQPLQLLDVSEEVARELLRASESRGLIRLQQNLAIQIKNAGRVAPATGPSDLMM